MCVYAVLIVMSSLYVLYPMMWSVLTSIMSCFLARNCGGVFCYDCAHHFMPVESELLNKPVRVCECCFDKLDGHLRKDNNSMDSSESTNKDI